MEEGTLFAGTLDVERCIYNMHKKGVPMHVLRQKADEYAQHGHIETQKADSIVRLIEHERGATRLVGVDENNADAPDPAAAAGGGGAGPDRRHEHVTGVHRRRAGLRRATNVVAGHDPSMVQQIGRNGLGVRGQGGNIDRAVLVDEFPIRQRGLQIGAVDLDGRRNLGIRDIQGAAADFRDMGLAHAGHGQKDSDHKQSMARDGGW